MASRLLAFDVYGTLIDPAGIALQLREFLGEKAAAAARLWREKQLEFTFRRALMRKYVDFDVCTAQALDYVLTQFGAPLEESARHRLLDSYTRLTAYPDVKPALAAIKTAGYCSVAFSNGTERSVRSLLEHADIATYFETVLSADRIGTFKPDPALYDLAVGAGRSAGEVWLISGNPFDIIGAKARGLRAAWVRRDPTQVFDPWEWQPDVIIPDLTALVGALPTS